MGPTNVDLVKLYQADQQLREAQEHLEAANKNVRVQERRTNDLADKLKFAQQKLREQQSQAHQMDLELKTRDTHIEKLRTQQQTAHNNKEYQAFLTEINTAKVDRNKIEDEAVKRLEEIEKLQAEAAALSTQLEAERTKLATMSAAIGDTLARLKSQVDALRPARDASAASLPPRAREAFERLAEHHDGDAMSAVAKPDRRREEYLCSACNMNLVTDVYNKLHTRDELVFCPSCRRLLYIPDDLPPELAIHSRGTRPAGEEAEAAPPKAGRPRTNRVKEADSRVRGRIGGLLAKAQGESVKGAIDADASPVVCEVWIDGKSMGDYKGKSREHLERVIRFRLDEAGVKSSVEVNEKSKPESAAEEAERAQSNSAVPAEPEPERSGNSATPST